MEQMLFGRITTVQIEMRLFSLIMALQEAFRNAIIVFTLLNVIYPPPGHTSYFRFYSECSFCLVNIFLLVHVEVIKMQGLQSAI